MFTLLALLVAPRADDVLPVPILELSEGDFVVGGYAGFGVFGADPFTRVWLALTLDGVGSGPCGPNGLCLGVVHPTAFLWGSSGLTSIRIWDLGVPAWVAGHTVCAQAVARVRGVWTASNVECRDVTVAGDPIAWGAGEYLVTQNVLPRADADRVCAAVGMSVALPDDPAEAAFLTDALAASGRLADPWVGAARDASGWVDASGAPVSYAPWAPGAPAAGGCAVQLGDGAWSDVACTSAQQVVCER